MSKPDRFRDNRNPYILPLSLPGSRDRRIDLLRGIAVLGISANHIWLEGSQRMQLPEYKFGHLFAFDFADVFILLSGIVAGVVFFPILIRSGLLTCYKKALHRAGQIWGVQIICVCLALMIVLLFEHQLEVAGSRLSPFDDLLFSAFAGNIFLYNPSIFLDILPVYVLLLLVLPPALMLFRRSQIGYFAFIGSLWALIWVPAFLGSAGLIAVSPESLKTPYFMHPLSAQLLFFTGVALGARKREIEAFIDRHKKQMLFGACAFLLITNYMAQVAWMVHHFDQKHFAGPLRTAELLAVLTICWCLIRHESFRSMDSGLVEVCGRHVLPVFAVTTIGAFFFTYIVHWLEAGRMIYGACITANVCLCLVSGYFLEKHRTYTATTRRSSAVAAYV